MHTALEMQGGTFTYALGNLRVSKIDVPRHKVVVGCKRDGSMTVKATDISAHLKGAVPCCRILTSSPARAPVKGTTELCAHCGHVWCQALFTLPPPRARLT